MTNDTIYQDQEREQNKYPFFDFLSQVEIQLILKHSNTVHYRKNDNIFLQKTLTSHIMYITTGLVKVYREGRMGKTVMLNLETGGNFVGLMTVFGKETHEFSASAIEPTDVLFIDITAFKQVLKSNGIFATNIIHLVSLNGLMLFDRLMAQTHKQLPGRIADVLLYFSETIYKNTRFSFPLTRRELAELAGTTKESFIRTLTEYKNDKIIELDGSEVEIKSIKIVKTLSELG